MTPEAQVKKFVKAILAKYKIWYFMPFMSGFGRAGIPDFICCIRGRLLGIETKAGRGKLTRIQEIEHQKINDAGGVCIVMRLDRMQALELLIHIMLRAPVIGTSNETVPATEENIRGTAASDEPTPQEAINPVDQAAGNGDGCSELPVGLRKCKHGTPFAYTCEECDADDHNTLCDHGIPLDEPCEECTKQMQRGREGPIMV